jgi:hypothetical protein
MRAIKFISQEDKKNDGNFLPSDRIDEYDLLTNSWSTSSLQEARTGMGVISFGNKVFFAGGQTPFGPSGKVEIRDIVTGLTSISCINPRGGLSAVLKDDKIVFFTGSEETREMVFISKSIP